MSAGRSTAIEVTRDRRRWGTLLWSTVASAVLHVIVLGLLFFAFHAFITPRGTPEPISETTIVTVRTHAPPKPTHVAAKPVRTRATHTRVAPPPPLVRHELARQEAAAPAQPPPRPPERAPSPLARDRAAFADEVARLNRSDDPHAIPTIDPASAGSPSKSYAFQPSANGDEHGNGIITPVKSWQEDGQDCYYARYSFTYPSGAMEYGNIVWPICYDPRSDPFHLPPHPMAFPMPPAGYTLPSGTDLPPLEKSAYEEWAAENGGR